MPPANQTDYDTNTKNERPDLPGAASIGALRDLSEAAAKPDVILIDTAGLGGFVHRVDKDGSAGEFRAYDGVYEASARL